MSCKHHVAGRCTNPIALPIYGDNPSRGVCRICAHYEGPPRGAGDVVEQVARLTGMKAVMKAVERATGKPCGCSERRRALNQDFPFKG